MSDVDEVGLVLAAEDFRDEDFRKYHTFTRFEDGIIRRLIAHGPVLLRGGRGSGKSALLKEASFRLDSPQTSASAMGVYLSLRHLPLLRNTGQEYEKILCEILATQIKEKLEPLGHQGTLGEFRDTSSANLALIDLAKRLGRRIVLLFDDAAHIGREASLEEFFGIFRTISSGYVSCKAAIYPGVTRFGTRFDVYNDATVIDLARNEESASFGPFFSKVLDLRFGTEIGDKAIKVTEDLSSDKIASFIGRAVLGNVRAFIYVCQTLVEETEGGSALGLPNLSETFLSTARGYFWPLFEELRPKLGMYEPLIEPATRLADELYRATSRFEGRRSVIVHRDYVDSLARLFEILEYTGFIGRRDASRAMKSGGRGTRFVMNLCNLLEVTKSSRLTKDLFVKWSEPESEPVELHHGSELKRISKPVSNEALEPAILDMQIDRLLKSKVYPYGLTEQKVGALSEHGFDTIGRLAEADDDSLDAIPNIGPRWVARIRNVVSQAIWM